MIYVCASFSAKVMKVTEIAKLGVLKYVKVEETWWKTLLFGGCFLPFLDVHLRWIFYLFYVNLMIFLVIFAPLCIKISVIL